MNENYRQVGRLVCTTCFAPVLLQVCLLPVHAWLCLAHWNAQLHYHRHKEQVPHRFSAACPCLPLPVCVQTYHLVHLLHKVSPFSAPPHAPPPLACHTHTCTTQGIEK